MKQRQRGATFLGMVVILLILGAALYAGIRLVPVYLEYTKVLRALEQVRDEHAAIDTNRRCCSARSSAAGTSRTSSASAGRKSRSRRRPAGST